VISAALRSETFDLRYANQEVIIEVTPPSDPAPLPKGQRVVIVLDNARNPTPADLEKIKAQQMRDTEVEPCDASMDKDDLLRWGNRYESRNRAEAYRCFQRAFEKSPVSLAALYGSSRTCDQDADAGCRARCLSQVIAARPDFYDARIELALALETPKDESPAISELKRILDENAPPVAHLQALKYLTFIAERAGDTRGEVQYREQLSEIVRSYFALYPKKFDAFYSRTSIVPNDQLLAMHLEGMGRWNAAEEIYRRNLTMISVDPIFEKETKLDNELGLARALSAQGKSKEAEQICSAWKLSASFIAGPSSTFDGEGSRHVEIAKWDLSCGKEQEGLALLAKEAAARPWMFSVYTALQDYYYAHGDAQNARKADEERSKAKELADARVWANMW
jgi:hypothetical protein